MLHITHSRAEGTLIDGTAKGDGTAEILKAHGWRWSRELGQWYVPRSRDALAQRERITTTAIALRGLGHEIDVDIDDTPRPVEDVEAARTARQAERTERLAERADRAVRDAQAAAAAMRAAEERLPPGGEPIKVGHHSEGRHRRDLDRAHRSHGASVEADRRARAAAERVTAAAGASSARYSAVTVANRIDKLEAEQRALVRRLEGHTRTVDASRGIVETTEPATGEYRARLEVTLAETIEQITYWREIRADQQATGSATTFGPQTVRPGDKVRIGSTWRRVVRANSKSVTVDTDHSWTARAPWHTVQEHQPAQAPVAAQ